MKKINQKGFGALEALLIVIVLIALGGISYLVYSKVTEKKDDTNTSSNNETNDTTSSSSTTESQSAQSSTPSEAFSAIKSKWLDLESSQSSSAGYTLEEIKNDSTATMVYVKSSSSYTTKTAKSSNAVYYRIDSKKSSSGESGSSVYDAYKTSVDQALSSIKGYITSDLGMSSEDEHSVDGPATSTTYSLYKKNSFYCQVAHTEYNTVIFSCVE